MNVVITKKAIELAGGPAVVGKRFGISSQAVSQWELVPPNRVLIIEQMSGVSRQKLRPDYYPEEDSDGKAA